MREWLSGRALPCQGRYRGSESRLPLQTWHHRQAVRLGSAKPLSPVRVWVVPPNFTIRRSGGMADARDLKSLVGNHVRVRVPPSAPKNISKD